MTGLSEMSMASDLCEAASIFAECRPRLTRLAFRVLGDSGEAEDVVQEAWIRWQTCDRSTVRNVPAFLATTTTRLALNAVQSARVRRVTYVDAWMPEPVDATADPVAGMERVETLERALRLILETLSPAERAAYVLREAFDYPYERIAQIAEQTTVNVRQLVSRARKHLAGEARTASDPIEQQRLLHAFVTAAQSGDLAPLEQLLTTAMIAERTGTMPRCGRPLAPTATRLRAPLGRLHSTPGRPGTPRLQDARRTPAPALRRAIVDARRTSGSSSAPPATPPIRASGTLESWRSSAPPR